MMSESMLLQAYPMMQGLIGDVMIDARCPSTLHFRLDSEAGLVETKCGRRRCGARPGIIVLHQFDIHTGELLRTLTFADPHKEAISGTHESPAAVRHAEAAPVPA